MRQTLATATKTQRLHVDWTACDGRGLCMELVPELLDADEWGYPISRLPKGSAVPADLVDAVAEAVAACPKRALRMLPG